MGFYNLFSNSRTLRSRCGGCGKKYPFLNTPPSIDIALLVDLGGNHLNRLWSNSYDEDWGRNFCNFFFILLTSAPFRNDIIDFYLKFLQLKFWLYLLNRLLSENPLPLVWKLLKSFLKISKSMASLSLISFWHNIIIFSSWLLKFLLKNIFPLIFEPLVPWTWLTLYFLAFWKIYTLIKYWWPISNGVGWCDIMFFS